MFIKERIPTETIQTNCHRIKSAVDQINYVLMVLWQLGY